MSFTTKREDAKRLDQHDPLASFRERFVIPDPDLIYLDGNSLGRLPSDTIPVIQEAVQHFWGKRLIRGWNEGWFTKPNQLGKKIACLIGAHEDEVVVGDTTSTNLFKLVTAALRAKPDRKKIISDELNFPSDLYIMQGVVDLLDSDHDLHIIPSRDTISIATADLEAEIDSNTALVALTHVAFKSAFMYDMRHITRLAHDAGAFMLWDLSHSTGAVPLKLNECGVDLAVGCTYKYLNGGPGSPAFLYVRRELQEQLLQPIWGWFGDQSPFEFNLEFTPAGNINRFQISTPHVLSMLGIEPALDILLEAGIEVLRKKSISQCEYLIHLAREWLLPLGFQLGSPEDSSRRGSHVSLRHKEGYRINRAMIESPPPAVRVIPDFRTPDNIRLGIAPLYTSYLDIYRGVERMREIVLEKSYKNFPAEHLSVT